MNILSLFDGISGGQVAINSSGVQVGDYFASEIDHNAVSVTQLHFPNTIQLGDVNSWIGWGINWSEIDLVIAGSPCQGFSFLGKRLNFEDPRSKLFFVFADILDYVKSVNPDVLFLLENVCMPQQSIDVINERLGVKNKFICSGWHSAATRPRMYWNNWNFSTKPDSNLKISDIPKRYLVDITDRIIAPMAARTRKEINKNTKQITDKHRAIITRSCNPSNNGGCVIHDNGRYYTLSVNGAEHVMGLPIGYTKSLSKTAAFKAIGNGWNIDTLKDIFRQMPS